MEADVLNLIQDWIGVLPLEQWLLVSALLSAGLMAVRQWRLYKKAESWLKDPKHVDIVVMSLAFGEPVVQFLVTAPATNPKLIALQGVVQAFMMHRIYLFVLKPGYGIAKKHLQPKIEAAKALNARPALLPAEPEVQDFSRRTGL